MNDSLEHEATALSGRPLIDPGNLTEMRFFF